MTGKADAILVAAHLRIEAAKAGKLFARFHPQCWIDDNAIEVDVGEREDTWPVPIEHALVADNTFGSDKLCWLSTAPAWVREWDGPFYVTIERR